MDGERLRQLRRHHGWDVPELAARIRRTAGTGHVADHDALVRMIRRWEAGQARMSERYTLLLATVFGLDPDDLAASPGVSSWPVQVHGAEGGEENPVNRREFSIATLGTLAGSLIPSARVPASVSPEHVAALRQAAAELWTRDRQVGGSAMLREATGYYASARTMLDTSSYNSRVGADLQAVTAELAICTGFAAFDAADQATARVMLTEATLLAVGYPLLAARAYSLLAVQSTALAARAGVGRAREALRFLDQASHIVRQEVSPKVHAIVAMRRATATALLGDEPGARRHIAAAYRELDRGDHHTDPHWAGFATVTEVTAHEAMAFLSLGKPGKAADVLRLVLGDKSLTDRNRAYYQARLAGALEDAGDRTQAVHEGLKVLPDLEGPVKSARTANWLRPIRARMPADSEFAVRLDAVALP